MLTYLIKAHNVLFPSLRISTTLNDAPCVKSDAAFMRSKKIHQLKFEAFQGDRTK